MSDPNPIHDTLALLARDLHSRLQKLGAAPVYLGPDADLDELRRRIKDERLVVYLVPSYPDTPTLVNSDLGLTLRDIVAVADGEDRTTPYEEIHDAVQSVAEALFAPPGSGAYTIPPEWWATGIGRLCRLALAVSGGGEELMTQAEAAAELGLHISTISKAIDTGRLQAVENADAPNPQKGRRLLFRSEVEAWKQEREARG